MLTIRLSHPPARIYVLFLLIAMVRTCGVNAQDVDLAELDAYFETALEQWPVPGFSVAIVKDGEVVLEKGYGRRHVLEAGETDEHTLYAIASNSKAFTSASLAMQVEQGNLSWDDRVVDILPNFRLYDEYVTQEIRVRDLLCHRSGLGTFSGDLLWYGTPYSPEEVVRRLRYLPQEFPFRAGYGYSNLMFITAGEVLRTVSGLDWHQTIQDKFFDPLEMTRSVTSVTELARLDNVATPHKNDRGEVIPVAWYNWDTMGAAGSIISSVHDMAQWLILQLGGGKKGGVHLFSEDSQRTMWTVHNPLAVGPAYQQRYRSTHFRGYGLGWSLADYRSRKTVSHGGGYDGMYSQVMLVPEEDLGIVVLTNAMTGIASSLVYRTLDAYLGGEARDWSTENLPAWESARLQFHARQDKAEAERIPDTQPSRELSAYTGNFGGELYGDATISLEESGLVLRLHPNPDLVADLEHLHFDTFLVQWRKTLAWFGKGTARFSQDTSGDIVELSLDIPNDDLWFHELDLLKKD